MNVLPKIIDVHPIIENVDRMIIHKHRKYVDSLPMIKDVDPIFIHVLSMFIYVDRMKVHVPIFYALDVPVFVDADRKSMIIPARNLYGRVTPHGIGGIIG